ncbi:glycosyltransferase [bacterium]|nr:glycosyltransferase [bacterium]
MNPWLLICIPAAVYAGVLIYFSRGLFRAANNRTPDQPVVSIVIAARNEEQSLPFLLGDLKHQTYPQDRLQFIIADDHSTDRTAEIVRSVSREDPRFLLVSVTRTEPGLTAKKNALTQAMRHASGEIILTTDADCRVLHTWTETMVSFFTADTGMVVGYSELCPDPSICTPFQKIQAVDFLMLMTAAQGTANLGRAWAASGQNLAYRKEVFDQVRGFSEIGNRISGDDVLFLQIVRRSTDWKVRFARSEKCRNHTGAERTLSAFLNQRKRWASNGAYQWKLNRPFFSYVVVTFVTNLLLFISLPFSLIVPAAVSAMITAWAIKFAAEAWLFIRGCRAYGRGDLHAFFPAWFFLQVPYVVFVGISGTLGGFLWKDRKHMRAELK